VTGRITEDPADTCSEAALLRGPEGSVGFRRDAATYRLPGLSLHVATIDLGCRNLRPPAIRACAAPRGRVYRFSAGAVGCRGAPGRGEEKAAIEFLKGLSAR
jgi:hypothetical protein